jgi:hypothetical protein
MAKDLTAIRIGGELIAGLKDIIANAPKDSVYRDRSVNWLIGRAVEEFIERHKPAAQPLKVKTPKPAAAQAKPEDPSQGF